MIVKIWPVKGDVGAGQCLLYIEDDKKVTKIETDEKGRVEKRTVINTVEELDENPDKFFIENEENIGRVFDYMANEVRPSNTAAIALYQGFGFREVGRRRNYYDLPKEDALILTKYYTEEAAQ